MRVSSQYAFERSLEAIQNRQSKLTEIQEQLSTGRRVTRPSDDPAAAAEAERMRSQLARVAIEQRAAEYARFRLAQIESAIGDASDLMQLARERMMQAGNGTLGADDRALIAGELRQLRDELLAVANRRDGVGGYLFGGQGSRSAPFVEGVGVSYQATAGEQLVGRERPLAPISADGREAFMSIPAGGSLRSAFAVLDDAVALLEDPAATSEAISTGVTDTLGAIDAGLERLLHKRTQVGERMRMLEDRERKLDNDDFEARSRLSEQVDVDFAEALSDLAFNQTSLEAAMRTYSEVSRMSLFDYL